MNWELLEYLKAFNAVFFSKTSKLVGFILCLKSLYRSMQVWLVTSASETLSCPSVFYCRICPNVNWLWSRESKIDGCQNFTLFTVLVGTCFLLKKRDSVFTCCSSLLCVCHKLLQVICVCVTNYYKLQITTNVLGMCFSKQSGHFSSRSVL